MKLKWLKAISRILRCELIPKIKILLLFGWAINHNITSLYTNHDINSSFCDSTVKTLMRKRNDHLVFHFALIMVDIEPHTHKYKMRNRVYGIKARKKPNNIHSNGKNKQTNKNIIYISMVNTSSAHILILSLLFLNWKQIVAFFVYYSQVCLFFFSYHKNWLHDVRLQRSCSTISVFCAAFHLSMPCLRSNFFIGCSFVFICSFV